MCVCVWGGGGGGGGERELAMGSEILLVNLVAFKKAGVGKMLKLLATSSVAALPS